MMHNFENFENVRKNRKCLENERNTSPRGLNEYNVLEDTVVLLSEWRVHDFEMTFFVSKLSRIFKFQTQKRNH